MLVLSRKTGDQMVIGNDIRVVVLRVTRGRVKLGFHAPTEVAIQRHELRSEKFSSISTSTGNNLGAEIMLTHSRGVREEAIIPGDIADKVARIPDASVSDRDRAVGLARSVGEELPSESKQNVGGEHEPQLSCSTDDDLRRRILNFLFGLKRGGLHELAVTVRAGEAILEGSVGTYYQKQLATQCCQRVAGVLKVTNDVSVRGYGEDHGITGSTSSEGALRKDGEEIRPPSHPPR